MTETNKKLDIKSQFSPQNILALHEQPSVSIHIGDSPIIFSGPHNGTLIPEALQQHKSEWLNNEHEAYDIGMEDLFKGIQSISSNTTLIASNYSRLVTDNARRREVTITTTSPEHNNKPIMGNQLSDYQAEQRKQEFYDPYHSALSDAIARVRAQHGYAIVIDLHSFTPEFRGQKRNTQIGTIRHQESSASLKLEEFLSQKFGTEFKANWPYDLKQGERSSTTIAKDLSTKNSIDYIGIEIRNDLLNAPKYTASIAQIIIDSAHKLAKSLKSELTQQHSLEPKI